MTATNASEGLAATGVKNVIFASSLGTVFEWYDFYLYATLAPFFATLFFPKGNATAALLGSFVSYAAGFLVRPFGAAAGQGVVWYTGQFYALFFLTGTLKVDWKTSYLIIAASLALGTGLFIF